MDRDHRRRCRWRATSALAKGRLGWSGLYLTVLNSDAEYGLSFDTRGLEKDLRTPSSSSQFFQLGRTPGVAVVGVQNEWLLTALADLLADAGPCGQIR
jgi:hypothetical protein